MKFNWLIYNDNISSINNDVDDDDNRYHDNNISRRSHSQRRLLEGPSEIKKPKSDIIQDKGQVTNVNWWGYLRVKLTAFWSKVE